MRKKELDARNGWLNVLAKAVLQLEFCPSLVALAEETWMLAMRICSQNCVLSLVLCFVGTSLVGPTMIRYLHAMLKNGFEAPKAI